MADNTTVTTTTTSEIDISALKATLCAQQNLLQKLYNELDAEREASASAASEALSVILRLQGEKAAVKMEAEQYKRLSEEKMSHSEESLAIIKEIIYQKEMEIAALDCQVQAYRYKLLSMGCVDFGDNPLQENENLGGEMSFRDIGRRNSGPNLFKYNNAVKERDGSCLQEMDCDRASDSDKKTDNSVDSYGEQIRKLDVRVKEIASASYTNLCDLSNSATRSPSPQTSVTDSYHQNKVAGANESNETKVSANLLQNVDYPCSPSVHDVFEVPQIDRNLSSCESHAKDENETANLFGKDVDHPEPDWLKKLLKSNHCEKQLREPSYDTSIECRLAVVQPTTSVSESQPGLCRLNGISEIIEVERPTESTNRDDELKLLNEIKEQLNSLHEEIRDWKVKKTSKRDEPSLCALSEAMLYFWL